MLSSDVPMMHLHSADCSRVVSQLRYRRAANKFVRFSLLATVFSTFRLRLEEPKIHFPTRPTEYFTQFLQRYRDKSCILVLSPFTAMSTLMLQSSNRLFLMNCELKKSRCSCANAQIYMACSCCLVISSSETRSSCSLVEKLREL